MPKQNIFVAHEFNSSLKHYPLKSPKLSIFFSCLLLLFIWGCSTTNHAILPTQAFLDITSHYNAYFNANEKLGNTLKTIEATHKDKFDSVISVYYYTDARDFAASTSDLDDVVKRSTRAIQLRGASNWSDDHFLLIGISTFLKGDYDKAGASFKYITTEYKEGVDYVKVMKSLGKRPGNYVKAKKKKKKPEVKIIVQEDGTKKLEKVDKRPSFSLWLHEPARSEALLWLIKTYTRQQKYNEAATVVTFVRSDDFFYKNLQPQLDLVDADLKVSRKDYKGAIEPLENYLKAKKIRKRKKLKVRPLFVLAQCYEATGNNSKAIESYKAVLKSRPNYDMEFYAKLKMAKLGRGASGSSDIRNLLAKMAKDGKYNDYLDQIYFELALISISEKNNLEARKFLHKSIDNSTTNDDQKALSFMTLAELDYQDETYAQAKLYYDSTLTFMAKNDARYGDIELRDKMLENLMDQLTIIANEDSLQKLAALPAGEREKLVKAALAKKEQEEENRKQAEADAKQQGVLQGLQNIGNTVNPNLGQSQTSPAAGASTWYFYNTALRATGYNDYTKRWGRRKLEENWRRKNKNSVNVDEDETVTTATDSLATDTKTDEKIPVTEEDKMLASLPTTPEKMTQSQDRTVDAYYAAGTIYKDGLDNYPRATEMFESMNSKYPKNKLQLESYYNIYLIALKQGQKEKAETYKNLIQTQYPESVIAKVLRDPNYVNEAKKKEQAVDDYYQSAYIDYSRDSLTAAWYKTEMADNLFKPNPLSEKFKLLAALILAKQNRLTDYVQSLNSIINKSKDAEVKKAATDLLANLNRSALPQIDLSKDLARRDSLNAIYFIPDTSLTDIQKQLNEAKELAKQNGTVVITETPTTKTIDGTPNTNNTKDSVTKASTVAVAGATDTTKQNSQANVVAEDTTSVYTRTDAAVHYFVIYIKDPTAPQSIIMSTMAKVNAFNSTQYPEKRLVSKQVLIDSKNKLLNIRQFKSKEDIMAYFNVIKKQGQLFDDLKPEQYAITCISTLNFSVLLNEKDIDAYGVFFNRVYK